MSVIRPALSSSERTTERRAVTVIRRSPSFLRPQTIVEGLPQETPTDPYLPVDWKTGDVITAARLNATDRLKAQQPTKIPTTFIDNLF